MNKSTTTSLNFGLPLAFLFVLLVGLLVGVKLEKEGAIASPLALTEKYPKKIDALFHFLDAKYINEIDKNQLLQQTIDHLKTADKNPLYIPSKQLKRINEQVDIKPYRR